MVCVTTYALFFERLLYSFILLEKLLLYMFVRECECFQMRRVVPE